MKLNKEQVLGWISELASGHTIEFGFCPRSETLTPAIVESAGPEGVTVKCGICGLTNQEFRDRDKHYRVGNDMTVGRARALSVMRLDTVEGQIGWLKNRLENERRLEELSIEELTDQLRNRGDRKRDLAHMLGALYQAERDRK